MKNVERVDAFDDLFQLSDAGRIALALLLDNVEAWQRQRCANRVLLLCEPEQDEELRQACLNATGDG